MKNTRKILLLLTLILFTLGTFGCENISTAGGQDLLKVHYIDVGQGDSILIQKGGQNMLIDAGENQYSKKVCEYLKAQDITKLDYVIGTHPHSDHIGGLDDVIETFEIGKVLMPKVSHNTKTFEDVLLAIQKKGLKITPPIVGDTYDLGEAQWTILAPGGQQYDSLNNYSVVVKLEYGESTFLFTGDAEKPLEEEILQGDLSPSVEVLKLGHHGSSTSTTDDFLQEVNPKTAILSLGKDNTYGHPHREIMEKLQERNIEIYRTDHHGSIIASSDGKTIEFDAEKSTQEAKGSIKRDAQKYIGNKNSLIFHSKDCNSLPQEENRVYFENKNKALGQGYKPHAVCIP